MTRAFSQRSLAEVSLALAGSAIAMLLFGWTRVWLVSLIAMGEFQDILEALPDQFTKLSPVPIDQLATHAGRIGMTFEELIVFCIMTIWAVSSGSRAVSGKIGSGTMEMLLAQPISRIRLLMTQSCIAMLGTGIIALALLAGIWIGILTNDVQEPEQETLSSLLMGSMAQANEPAATVSVPMRKLVSIGIFLPATLQLFALGWCFLGITTFLSSWDRYRWRTVGLASALIFIQLFLEIVAMSSDHYAWLSSCTLMSAYEPVDATIAANQGAEHTWALFHYNATGELIGLGMLGQSMWLIALGLLGNLAAAIIFCRRNLPAPL